MQYHHIVLDEAVEELTAPGAGAHYDGAKAKLSMVKFVGAVSESPIWGGKLGEALPHTEWGADLLKNAHNLMWDALKSLRISGYNDFEYINWSKTQLLKNTGPECYQLIEELWEDDWAFRGVKLHGALADTLRRKNRGCETFGLATNMKLKKQTAKLAMTAVLFRPTKARRHIYLHESEYCKQWIALSRCLCWPPGSIEAEFEPLPLMIEDIPREPELAAQPLQPGAISPAPATRATPAAPAAPVCSTSTRTLPAAQRTSARGPVPPSSTDPEFDEAPRAPRWTMTETMADPEFDEAAPRWTMTETMTDPEFDEAPRKPMPPRTPPPDHAARMTDPEFDEAPRKPMPPRTPPPDHAARAAKAMADADVAAHSPTPAKRTSAMCPAPPRPPTPRRRSELAELQRASGYMAPLRASSSSSSQSTSKPVSKLVIGQAPKSSANMEAHKESYGDAHEDAWKRREHWHSNWEESERESQGTDNEELKDEIPKPSKAPRRGCPSAQVDVPPAAARGRPSASQPAGWPLIKRD